MPATIQRNPAKTGLTLLSSQTSVAEDGFVRVTARFLAPAAGLADTDFLIDSAWPLATLPVGLPATQGGPFLVERTIQKESGLTYVDAVYATALLPVRSNRSESVEQATFDGYGEVTVTNEGGTTTTSGSLKFDYYTTAVTLSYALVVPNAYSITPTGSVSAPFNIRKTGQDGIVATKQTDLVSSSREIVGRVSRVSVTARRVIEQADANFVFISPYAGSVITTSSGIS